MIVVAVVDVDAIVVAVVVVVSSPLKQEKTRGCLEAFWVSEGVYLGGR